MNNQYELMKRHFPALLRKYRMAAGLTQREVSEKAEMSSSHYSKLERGKRWPRTMLQFFLLADALGVTATTLIEALDEEIKKEKARPQK